MRIEVSVEGGEDDLRSLHGWLRDDPDVRRTADLTLLESPTRPGDMGAGLDLLQLLTGNGWSAISFAIAVATWRQARHRNPQVTVRRGDTVVELSNCNEAEVQRLIAWLEEADGEGRHQ
ncbi:hypothetical protein FBY35_3395 [Streptomyces sp. SLBN-118]|uniref:effector-associated constant component EACC1 n=1 Tax=Streptomyces sp. SLBN-118 TaxID=2768454 RepID=UPI00114E8539|nr:hypothetical protein [Streptomyces sp. SLBN-118]TQK52932.1 hypothetical protein FBY35_3395 [Streptomyces sp. SLBN-118]